jgi:hypothetical protein
MLKYLRRLTDRKGKTPRKCSRSRQGRLTLELLGERILLSAGSSISPFIGPLLPGPGDFGWSAALADNGLVPVSSNYDDPFVRPDFVRWMDPADFDYDNASGPTRLSGPRVLIRDMPLIYRMDPQSGEYKPFAENPWPEPTTNRPGNFVFDEPRFPFFTPERGPDGKILRDQKGLQLWGKNDLHDGMTTAFDAANQALHASEGWAGRRIPWGINGRLEINTHWYIDLNAVYSPADRALYFGVVPYRYAWEQQIRMFEMATSWEAVAHESGHALQDALKPNIDHDDTGYQSWTESFADQTAMWSALQDPGRARALLQEANGNLYRSNSLTRFGEFFASLVSEGNAERDAFNHRTVSTTSDERHERSEVLTGAAYKIFYQIFGDLTQQGMSDFDALQKAGDIMGIFLTRATDHTPEDTVTLEDVGKAYLKVDKEYFGGKYRDILADEFRFREIFNDNSLAEFDAHEAALPQLTLQEKTPRAANQLIQDNLDKLGMGPEFGLRFQSYTVDTEGRQIVRVILTRGRGDGAQRLDNHGVLVFRPDGSLMDYHGPLAPGFNRALALQRLDQAQRLGIDQHGAPLAIRQAADGQLQVEARLLQGDGIHSLLQVFSLDHPNGQRRAIGSFDAEELEAFLPKGAVILSAEDLQAAENTTLDAVFAAAVAPRDWLPVSQSSSDSSVHPQLTLSAISRGLLVGASDFLTRRSGADTADSDAHKAAMLHREPGGTGDGISPGGLIDQVFAGGREVGSTLD